jgi:hypothetical protein
MTVRRRLRAEAQASPGARAGRVLRLLAAALALAAVSWAPALLLAPAAGAAQLGVSLDAVVNGQAAATSSDARPAQLNPNRPAEVRITVANEHSSTLTVTTVRFEGEVLNLPLFSYDSTVDLVVGPRETKTLTFPVSVTGVGNQATGLIVASVTLLSPEGQSVASQSLVTDVHGSLASVYGLFGLAVLALTISSIVFGLLAMARHRLPQNRWLRALRFLIPGFGVGLVLTFTLSAFSVFTPGPGHWLSILIMTSATGLALGYLTPAPNEEEFDDYDEDVLLAQIVVVDDDPLEVAQGPRETSGVPQPVGRATMLPDSRATVV